MAGAAKTTTDHRTIQRWAEQRGGKPAAVSATHPDEGSGGILRIAFTDEALEESLEEISWDEFFRTFEDRKLAFLYQDEKDGHESRFFKLVDRTQH